MREIKFRAWDEEQEEYYSFEQLGQYDKDATILLFDIMTGKDSTITLEQFTGLHDKNGKEIYEGDIVKCYVPESPEIEANTGYVSMENPSYLQILWTSKDDKGKDVIDGFPWFHSEWTHCLEVIGNTHQEPQDAR